VNIRNASVALTVTILNAIERAIGFFISNECKSGDRSAGGELTRPVLKGGKVLFTRGDYEKDLLQSLDMIKEKSRSLMEEAAKSHIHEVHMCAWPSRSVGLFMALTR